MIRRVNDFKYRLIRVIGRAILGLWWGFTLEGLIQPAGFRFQLTLHFLQKRFLRFQHSLQLQLLRLWYFLHFLPCPNFLRWLQ